MQNSISCEFQEKLRVARESGVPLALPLELHSGSISVAAGFNPRGELRDFEGINQTHQLRKRASHDIQIAIILKLPSSLLFFKENLIMYKRQSSSNRKPIVSRFNHSIYKAFTLVELLVVISIIGILIALTIPATTAARDRARQARCISNIKQTNLATMEYITRNGYFPGWKNQFRGVTQTSDKGVNGSWIAALLPFFNEGALEKKWVEGVAETACLLYLICPADARPDKESPHLSYVANCGNTKGTSRDAGVFLDLEIKNNKRPTKQTLDFITSNDGLSSTIMTSENNQAYMWGPDANISEQGFVFFDSNPNTLETSQALNWDYRGVLRNAKNADAYARPSSYHPGGVNTSWCDSRVVKLNDDIDYEIYKMMLAPNDRGCGVSQASLSILHEMINVQ